MSVESPVVRAVLISMVGLAMLTLGAAAWLWARPDSISIATVGPQTTSGTALVGGPFELVDQHGQVRRDADFRGRHMLVYFGFTYCPDACPTSLLAMTQALEALAESDPAAADEVVPIFITVDPERDTVAALAAYATHFHEALVALTGTAEQVAAAAKAYRVHYAKGEEGGTSDYLTAHTSFIYLMNRSGRYLTHFAQNATAEAMAENLEKRIVP